MSGAEERPSASPTQAEDLHRALRCLATFMAGAVKTVDDLRSEVARLAKDPAALDTLPRIADRLALFAGETRAAGFEDISEAAKQMEQVVRDLLTGKRTWHSGMAELLRQMSELLSFLLYYDGSDQKTRALEDLQRAVSQSDDTPPVSPEDAA